MIGNFVVIKILLLQSRRDRFVVGAFTTAASLFRSAALDLSGDLACFKMAQVILDQPRLLRIFYYPLGPAKSTHKM